MTDKQIIVNGIDVNGCGYYADDKCMNSNILQSNCKNVAVCYYKEYKRKEQENKDLREDIKDIANLLDLDTGEEYSFGNIELEIKQLKAKEQECETLASQLDFEVQKKECLEQECERLKREIDIRSCANIELSLEFKKYKKAIDEIEEIADNNYENPEMERIFKIIGGLDV